MKMLSAICVLILAGTATVQGQTTMEPAPEHIMLQKEAGKWSGRMKVWMSGPNQPPLEMPMTETVEVLPGGFWTRSVFESGPFRGYSQMGFDPVRKKFVGTWVDSSTPFINVMEGTMDKQNNTLVMTHDGYDQQTMKPAKFRTTTLYKSDDERKFTMEQQAEDGKTWVKSFVIEYSRSK